VAYLESYKTWPLNPVLFYKTSQPVNSYVFFNQNYNQTGKSLYLKLLVHEGFKVSDFSIGQQTV